MTGVALYRSADGSLIGETPESWGTPVANSDSLFVGGKQMVIRAATEGPSH